MSGQGSDQTTGHKAVELLSIGHPGNYKFTRARERLDSFMAKKFPVGY